MFANPTYYMLKPALPFPLRLALRRRRATARRRAYAGVWPIDEAAGATPPGWPGWLDRKRFAVILTHDVEGNKGLRRIRRLMDLELKFGFRSSFNLVPEGDYQVSEAVRSMLSKDGFEIGVHGLNHDGKLYSSEGQFARKATEINRYFNQWQAFGFRSPLMQHRLDWLHRLNIEYDCSTFDTDPFEPEPDGAVTIFPFWVPGTNGSGFVELPYTLVQDFNLFIVLRENNIDIWKQKLEWVAARGGMVLLDTHPDYMALEGKPARDEYPVAFYEEFLRHVREQYDGQFWTATPREVARYYRDAVPAGSRNTRKKICMLAYSHYETDNRVRRYAETLARRGDLVEVISLGNGKDLPLGQDNLSGVTVHRIQTREPDEKGKWAYAKRQLQFLVGSARFLSRRHREIRYDLIHVHNMPDFLVFAAWYAKWDGAKVILDIHDIVPELFMSKFGTDRLGPHIRLLRLLEKASAAFAHHVVVSNHLWIDKLTARSIPEHKCSVFLNHVDPAMFFPHQRTRDDHQFVIAFPGSFQWHQGLDIAIEALAEVKKQVPSVELHLYGSGRLEADLRALADRLGLNDSVRFLGSIPLDQIPGVMANADLGVVPKRADGFGNEAYSTKIMEFMSQGVPVVASRTRIDQFYFDDQLVRFFTSGDAQAMADAILDLIAKKPLRDALAVRGLEYVDHNSWDKRKLDYLDLVDSLSVGATLPAERRFAYPGHSGAVTAQHTSSSC
jgi:glycosyltransferase involved in cell wall biosynthesis